MSWAEPTEPANAERRGPCGRLKKCERPEIRMGGRSELERDKEVWEWGLRRWGSKVKALDTVPGDE